ncbi:hypothetical protein OC842_007755, partial [Tilletia horrida]
MVPRTLPGMELKLNLFDLMLTAYHYLAHCTLGGMCCLALALLPRGHSALSSSMPPQPDGERDYAQHARSERKAQGTDHGTVAQRSIIHPAAFDYQPRCLVSGISDPWITAPRRIPQRRLRKVHPMLSRNFFLLATALLAGQALALDSTQQSHAQTIANVAKNYGTNSPQHACVTAVATAITDANSKVPASLNYPHDKVGSDHDSVGLFQQRVSIYKNIAADMDATGSTRQFLAEMVKISGWQSIAPGTLAQKVQRSA